MKEITTRRTILRGLSAAAASTIFSGKAAPAEFVYKMGTNVPATHPLNIRAQEAAVRIREQTSGRVEPKLRMKTIALVKVP